MKAQLEDKNLIVFVPKRLGLVQGQAKVLVICIKHCYSEHMN